MAKKKGKGRRRKPAFSILNALEAYTYATIMTEGIAGTSPFGLILGDTDLGMSQSTTGLGAAGSWDSMRGSQQLGSTMTGAGEISLGDMMKEPGLALGQMQSNFRSNIVPMALAAFTVRIGFKFGKRALRGPISSVNRNIVKPALGAGIRL
jgi:hypothetical protein